MALDSLLSFMLIAAFAGYFQTVTGFGLAMIVMGATSGMAIAPVASVAAVVSLMMLVNCAVALPGKLKHVDWCSVRSAALGIVPAIVVGILLLDYLSGAAASVLRIALGVVVLYGGVSLVLRPRQRTSLSTPPSFFVAGMLSGLCGGLFGIAGPPLIYHCYRQPLPFVSIGNMLILLFAVTSGMRTLFVILQGRMDSDILILTAWAIPLVVLATYAGRCWPPPLSSRAMRRVAMLTLMAIGGSLIGAELL